MRPKSTHCPKPDPFASVKCLESTSNMRTDKMYLHLNVETHNNYCKENKRYDLIYMYLPAISRVAY